MEPISGSIPYLSFAQQALGLGGPYCTITSRTLGLFFTLKIVNWLSLQCYRKELEPIRLALKSINIESPLILTKCPTQLFVEMQPHCSCNTTPCNMQCCCIVCCKVPCKSQRHFIKKLWKQLETKCLSSAAPSCPWLPCDNAVCFFVKRKSGLLCTHYLWCAQSSHGVWLATLNHLPQPHYGYKVRLFLTKLYTCFS